MRRLTTITLCFTCTAGAFGVFLRWLQLITAFETDTGLPIKGARLSIAVTVLSLFAAVFLILVTVIASKKPVPEKSAVKLPVESFVFSLVSKLVCVLAVVGAVLLFISAGGGSESGVTRMLAAAALAAGLSYPAFISRFKRSSGVFTCILSLIPVVFCSFWLIVSYKDHAANPVIWEFAFEILAISASVLSLFFVAGYPCGSPKPFISFYFCNLSAFLCIVTLADPRPLPLSLTFASLALIELMYAGGILSRYK